jgi:hypothetical protein
MRGSTTMGNDNRSSKMRAATLAIAVRVRRESATVEVTQLSGLLLVRRSLGPKDSTGRYGGPSAMIGTGGRVTFGIRRHMTRQPDLAGEPAVAGAFSPE